MSKRTLKDLQEASYNPRTISDKKLENLKQSIGEHGDLSGVVFNVKTKTLISGHQRLKTIRRKGVRTKIDTHPVKDEFGTVAVGYIIALTETGTVRIPYREVSWSNRRAEKAANIAANAHGGDFDREKLSELLVDLAEDKSFNMDLLGLDPLTVKTLMPPMPNVEDGEEEESFAEYDADSFEFEHQCPKCGYRS